MRFSTHDATAPAARASDASIPNDIWFLYSELNEISIQLAIVASIANAKAPAAPCRFEDGDLLMFTPSVEGILRSADRFDAEPEIYGTLVHSIRRLALLIGFARNMTSVHVGACSDELLPAVADGWMRAASTCVVAGILLERELPVGQISEPVAPASGVRRLLREACGGGWPCIDESGGLRIPGWADRRSETRSDTRMEIRIVSSAGEGSGVVLNVSPNGLKISSGIPLAIGDQVKIITPTDLDVSGEVIWSSGGEAGIQTFRPIDPARLLRI